MQECGLAHSRRTPGYARRASSAFSALIKFLCIITNLQGHAQEGISSSAKFGTNHSQGVATISRVDTDCWRWSNRRQCGQPTLKYPRNCFDILILALLHCESGGPSRSPPNCARAWDASPVPRFQSGQGNDVSRPVHPVDPVSSKPHPAVPESICECSGIVTVGKTRNLSFSIKNNLKNMSCYVKQYEVFVCKHFWIYVMDGHGLSLHIRALLHPFCCSNQHFDQSKFRLRPCSLPDMLRVHNDKSCEKYSAGAPPQGGGWRGGETSPIFERAGDNPPIFRKIVGQIRLSFQVFNMACLWQKSWIRCRLVPVPPHFHRRGGAPGIVIRSLKLLKHKSFVFRKCLLTFDLHRD